MINVAIIGFGHIGIAHAMNIQRNPKLNLCAIVTRNTDAIPSRLKEQMGNFSIGEIDSMSLLNIPRYVSLQECLTHEKIDAVHICVHTDLHYSIAKEAIENGLHVLLEKPISLDLEEARSLVQIAKDGKIKFMVAHVLRFMPAYLKLKEWIDTNEFGKLEFISLTRHSGTPAWGQWKEKCDNFGSSGGALFDLLIHDIDFLNYALGIPKEIHAVCYPGQLSNYDYVSADWHYDTVKARIEGGNLFHSGFPFHAGFRAKFENASVVYSSINGSGIQVCTNDSTHRIVTGDPNDGFYNEIDYFASCIKNNTNVTACLPESSVEAIELCYKHMTSHKIEM